MTETGVSHVKKNEAEPTSADVSRHEAADAIKGSLQTFVDFLGTHAAWVLPALTALGVLLAWWHVQAFLRPIGIGFHELSLTLTELLITTFFLSLAILLGISYILLLSSWADRLSRHRSFVSSYAAMTAAAFASFGVLLIAYLKVWDDSSLLVLASAVGSAMVLLLVALVANANFNLSLRSSRMVLALFALLVAFISAGMSWFDSQSVASGDRTTEPFIMRSVVEMDAVRVSSIVVDVADQTGGCMLYVGSANGVTLLYAAEPIDRVLRLPTDGTALIGGCEADQP